MGSGGESRNYAMGVRWPRLLLGVALLIVLVAVYVALSGRAQLDVLTDRDVMHRLIEGLGWWGPFAVIALLALAIVVTPVPSAPIALASGAAYGHTWGTVYVVLGAELGAAVAYCLARLLGREVLQHWFKGRLDQGLLGSQNALMAIVFVSRLLPFISFDVVSYAAGLSALRFWRFALATLLGIIPASFLLAHFGSQLTVGNAGRVAITLLGLGILTVIPWIIRRMIHKDRA